MLREWLRDFWAGRRYAGGGAVSFATYLNQADAFIGANAIVNAPGLVTVDADAIIPNHQTTFDSFE